MQNQTTKTIRENQKKFEEFLKGYPRARKEANDGVYLSKTERNNVVAMISIYRIDKMTVSNLKYILKFFANEGTYPNLNEKKMHRICEDAREAGLIE